MERGESNLSGSPGGAGIRAQLSWSDNRLLEACRVEFIRVSGPGGQHRNKVSSGVRITHQPSDVVVTATERRSQHENKAMALRRLRDAIAITVRAPLPESTPWPDGAAPREGRLRVNERNPAWPLVAGLALDALAEAGGRVAQAGLRLGASGSSLTKFLSQHPKLWAEANRIRAAHGLGALSPLR